MDEKDEKDRLGSKLQEKGRGDEGRYFAQRDREALEKLKHSAEVSKDALMRCPKCGTQLKSVEHHGVTVEECPSCQGLWLEPWRVRNVIPTGKRRLDWPLYPPFAEFISTREKPADRKDHTS